MQSNESRIIDALSDMDDRLEDSGVYELNPDIVAGWVEMCLGALEVLVTAKRGKYPHDPALSQSVYIHLDHAFNHMDIATDASDRDELDHKHGKSSAVDDDGILHIHHATARVALALTRKALVELEKTETRLSNCVIGAGPQYCTMTVSRRTTQPECPNRCIPNGHAERIHGVKWSGSVYNPPSGIARDGGVACGIIGNHESQGVNKNDVCSERRNDCVTVELLGPKLSDAATVTTRAQAEALFGKSCWLANWFPSEPPNSCKVDKVERNSPVVMNSFSAYGDDGGYWYYYRPVEGGITYTTSPARKLDTDCSLGNVTDKCEDKWGAGKPVTQWSMWIDDVRAADCANCEMQIDEVALPGPIKTGATESRRPMPVPTFAGIPTPYKPATVRNAPSTPIGTATSDSDSSGFATVMSVSGAMRVMLLNKPVRVGQVIYSQDVVGRIGYNGCSYAKWPNKGPGYSERCDKCKRDALRPSYCHK